MKEVVIECKTCCLAEVIVRQNFCKEIHAKLKSSHSGQQKKKQKKPFPRNKQESEEWS
jgi:hypothetical protein